MILPEFLLHNEINKVKKKKKKKAQVILEAGQGMTFLQKRTPWLVPKHVLDRGQ